MALTPEQAKRADLAFNGICPESEESPEYPSERNSVVNAMILHYSDLMFLADRHGLDTSTMVSAGTYLYRKELGDLDAEAAARIAAADKAAELASNYNSAKARVRRKREELQAPPRDTNPPPVVDPESADEVDVTGCY